MEKLFLEAKNLSSSENKNEKELLELHINTVMDLIVRSHETIIKFYASKYYNCAPMLICNTKYLYDKIININKLLYPDKHLANKHIENDVVFLIDRLRVFFKPFNVKIIKGHEIITLYETIFNYKININNIDNNIICIIVSWE